MPIANCQLPISVAVSAVIVNRQSIIGNVHERRFASQHVHLDGARLTLDLLSIVIILVTAFVIGALVTSHVAWLRRLFTPRGEMQTEVHERARQTFFDQRIHHTKSSGGLLIYVSLFERMAAVIADETVIEKLGMPAIEALCNHLTAKLHDGELSAALEDTILRAGDQLVRVVPRESGDVNELADALVTMD